jgi:hypothetical protein
VPWKCERILIYNGFMINMASQEAAVFMENAVSIETEVLAVVGLGFFA